MKKILPLIIITILSLFALWDSFKFALSGDDWLELYRHYIFFPDALSLLNVYNYSYSYLGGNLLMGLINHFTGFTPVYYYFMSFLFRIAAGFSLAFAAYKIS